jgi:flagellar hook-associated protein 1 FlgK
VSSTFSGLNTARTALYAQQRAVDVTGQNIANVNTAGYSRQRAELQSVGGALVPALYAVGNGLGQGVNADTITRIRDAFLEGRAQTEHAAAASLTVADNTMSQIEDAFREPGDTGLQKQLDQMWSGWGDVANHPTEAGGRSEVLQQSATLVAGLNTTSATLDQQWAHDLDSLGTLVQDVNASIDAIADLNRAIGRADSAGTPSSELADKRDALVLALSDQVGATSSTADDGSISVRIGNATVVNGTSAVRLALSGGSSLADAGTNPPRLVTASGGTSVVPGGTADGLLTAMATTIPAYKAKLDAIASQLAGQLNGLHQQGYDLDGNPGKPVFDGGAGSTTTDASGKITVDLSKVTAGSIRLALTDGRQLAAAGLSTTDTGGTVSGDAKMADAIHQLRLGTTGADANYRKMIVGLGVDAASATSRLTAQSVISAQVDSSRESVSGVSIDEEMTNMLAYQHGYQAAGRLVSAIDEMLDQLINHTGRVGL